MLSLFKVQDDREPRQGGETALNYPVTWFRQNDAVAKTGAIVTLAWLTMAYCSIVSTALVQVQRYTNNNRRIYCSL